MTLDTLCADALRRLPAHDELAALAARLLPGCAVERRGEDAGRAGDSLAQRSVDATAGGLRLVLTADWLDRRGSDGAEIRDTPRPRQGSSTCAPASSTPPAAAGGPSCVA